MVWLAALTGCRWSEAAGLRVEDLDLLARTVTFAQVIVKDASGRPLSAGTKSDASHRAIAIPDPLVDILAAHLARRGLTAADDQELVFVSPSGGMLQQDNWRRRVWLPAVQSVGLDKGGRRPGFHDLRRAVGTTLVAAGIDPKTAQKRLGHADIRTTLQIHAQGVEERDREAADVLAARFMIEPRDRSRPQRAQNPRQRPRVRSALPPKRTSGGERTRTADFYVANVALCQLSYTPRVQLQDSASYIAPERPVRRCFRHGTPGDAGHGTALDMSTSHLHCTSNMVPLAEDGRQPSGLVNSGDVSPTTKARHSDRSEGIRRMDGSS